MSRTAVLRCALIVLCINTCQHVMTQMIGPANVQLTKLEECEDPAAYPYSVAVTKTRYNRTVEAFEVNITLPEYKQLGFRTDTAKLGDGGYKPGAYRMEEQDACAFIMAHCPDSAAELLELLNHEPSCPFRPGVYWTDRWVLSNDRLPSQMLYGDFRTDIVLFDGEQDLMCYRLYILVEARNVLG